MTVNKASETSPLEQLSSFIDRLIKAELDGNWSQIKESIDYPVTQENAREWTFAVMESLKFLREYAKDFLDEFPE